MRPKKSLFIFKRNMLIEILLQYWAPITIIILRFSLSDILSEDDFEIKWKIYSSLIVLFWFIFCNLKMSRFFAICFLLYQIKLSQKFIRGNAASIPVSLQKIWSACERIKSQIFLSVDFVLQKKNGRPYAQCMMGCCHS